MRISLLAVLFCLTTSLLYAQDNTFRPPAVPLVVHDPYFSIWSPADKLTDAETVHWTGKKHPLHMMIRIDGKAYRLMGAEPADVPAMEQKSLEVGPLTTKYVFENETAKFTLSFTSPFLPNDLKLMSLPTVFVMLTYESKDEKAHDLGIYFDGGAEIAVNNPDQSVVWSNVALSRRGTVENFADITKAISVGTTEQKVLGKRGDDIRIDWGRFIVSVMNITQEEIDKQPPSAMRNFPFAILQDFSPRNGETARNEFAKTGTLQSTLPAQAEYRVDESKLSIVAHWSRKEVTRIAIHPIVLSYNDDLSIRYFGDDLPSYALYGFQKDIEKIRKETPESVPSWQLPSVDEMLLQTSWNILNSLTFLKGVNDFEATFKSDLTAVGGEDYAKLCALAYRQSLGAQKIVADVNGMPLMFSKENDSNGCMGTIDVMYPCSPLLLYYSPALVKATLQPIFAYAETEKWKFPFAPHDIGTYPHGTGQVYGGGERTEENQMPVEESANMIIQTAALAVAEQKPDFAKLHWKTLTKWADYLLEKGFDPDNQLCTDDFAGHLAHNVNLSAKAIVAIAAYAQLAEKLGEKETAKKYRDAAEEFVKRWVKEADDGDHFRLAFDKPGTWSMKYNLMWDEILDLKLFPKEVMRKEIAYYKTKIERYGLPLDNRSLYTKNDWILWTATMCESREDFELFVQPVVGFLNNTRQRVPLSDWYYTNDARRAGFKARSVVGGYWAPMLKDRKKWLEQVAKGADIDGTKQWAEILLPPRAVKSIVPTAEDGRVDWQYTLLKPADGWEKPEFDDSTWQTGRAGFGTRGTPGAIVGTVWNTDNIWIRRSFDWDGEVPDNTNLQLYIHHDEDVDVYLNGVKICSRAGYISSYELIAVPNLLETLKKGKNTFAVSVKQTTGGQYIDVGISAVEKPKR